MAETRGAEVDARLCGGDEVAAGGGVGEEGEEEGGEEAVGGWGGRSRGGFGGDCGGGRWGKRDVSAIGGVGSLLQE